jgi:hypothetical protein
MFHGYCEPHLDLQKKTWGLNGFVTYLSPDVRVQLCVVVDVLAVEVLC